jgi:hypothetical protein
MSAVENESGSEDAMSSGELKHIGFTDPQQGHLRRRSVVFAQLIATVALVVSIAVAVTTVSIGIALAHAAPHAASLIR